MADTKIVVRFQLGPHTPEFYDQVLKMGCPRCRGAFKKLSSQAVECSRCGFGLEWVSSGGASESVSGLSPGS